MSIIRTKHISDTDKFIRHYTNPTHNIKGLNTVGHNFIGKVGDISSPNGVTPVSIHSGGERVGHSDISPRNLFNETHPQSLPHKKRVVKRKRKSSSTSPSKKKNKKGPPKKKQSKTTTGVKKGVDRKKRLPDIL